MNNVNFDNPAFLSDFLKYIYYFFLTIGGIATFAMLVWGGFRWLTSAGNPAGIGEAKDTIFSAIIGLVLLLGSYLILSTINPDLVIVTLPTISIVTPTPEETSTIGWGSAVVIQMKDTTFPETDPRYNQPCECNGWYGLDPPVCGDFCNRSCISGGYTFGTFAGCNAVSGTDVAWCSCYMTAYPVDPYLAMTFGAYTKCDCIDDGPTQCGTECIEECQSYGFTFGVLASCIGANNYNYCTCYNSDSNLSVYATKKTTESTNSQLGTECECNGGATPQCGEFCYKFCTTDSSFVGPNKPNYNFGTFAGCQAGSGTDQAHCTCMRFE